MHQDFSFSSSFGMGSLKVSFALPKYGRVWNCHHQLSTLSQTNDKKFILTPVWKEFGINFLEGLFLDNSTRTFLCVLERGKIWHDNEINDKRKRSFLLYMPKMKWHVTSLLLSLNRMSTRSTLQCKDGTLHGACSRKHLFSLLFHPNNSKKDPQ